MFGKARVIARKESATVRCLVNAIARIETTTMLSTAKHFRGPEDYMCVLDRHPRSTAFQLLGCRAS